MLPVFLRWWFWMFVEICFEVVIWHSSITCFFPSHFFFTMSSIQTISLFLSHCRILSQMNFFLGSQKNILGKLPWYNIPLIIQLRHFVFVVAWQRNNKKHVQADDSLEYHGPYPLRVTKTGYMSEEIYNQREMLCPCS